MIKEYLFSIFEKKIKSILKFFVLKKILKVLTELLVQLYFLNYLLHVYLTNNKSFFFFFLMNIDETFGGSKDIF